jgi:hypothetical protein
VQIQTDPGYTLSASGTSGEAGQVVLAKQLSQIHRPDAPIRCERSALVTCANIRRVSSQGMVNDLTDNATARSSLTERVCHISFAINRPSLSTYLFFRCAG